MVVVEQQGAEDVEEVPGEGQGVEVLEEAPLRGRKVNPFFVSDSYIGALDAQQIYEKILFELF